MSFFKALIYPIRGKNILNFLLLTVVFFVATSFLSLLGTSNAGPTIPLSIIMTGYYYLVLQQLALETEDLPNLFSSLKYFRNGGAIAFMQIVYFFTTGLIIYYSASYIADFSWLVILLLGGFVYLLTTVGTIRYVADEDWKCLYDVLANAKLVFGHFSASIRVLILSIGILAWIFNVYVGLSVVLGFAANYFIEFMTAQNLNLAFTQILNFLFVAILLHAVLAGIHVWNAYGRELGFFPIEEEKSKNDEYSFDDKPNLELNAS